VNRGGDECKVDDGSEEIADCIALLENTACETSEFYRKVFKG